LADKIQPVARPVENAQFLNTLANRLRIAHIASADTTQPGIDASYCAPIT
jgi:hypothetical protein